jgi:hypothetical protein
MKKFLRGQARSDEVALRENPIAQAEARLKDLDGNDVGQFPFQ